MGKICPGVTEQWQASDSFNNHDLVGLNMDVQSSTSRLPALYRGHVPSLSESMPYVPSLYPEDIVDCIEIRTERISPVKKPMTHYISVTSPIIEKGSLIDLFV
jgi:hypothetical protein